MRASISDLAAVIRELRNGKQVDQVASEMHISLEQANAAAQVWPLTERWAAGRGC